MSKVQIIVLDVPGDVMGALQETAQTEDVNVQQAAVWVLEHEFKVPKSGPPANRRRFVPGDTGDGLHLAVSERLRAAIRLRAAREGGTIRGVVIAALAKNYSLPIPAMGRRPKRGMK